MRRDRTRGRAWAAGAGLADGARLAYLRVHVGAEAPYVGLSARYTQGRRVNDLDTGVAFAPAWNPAPVAEGAAETGEVDVETLWRRR